MPPLDKLLLFVSPDVSILEWEEAHYEKTRAQCWQDFTGAEINERPNVTQTETATQVAIQRQKEGNPVYKYGVFFAQIWQHTVFAYADITGKRQGLEAQIFVSRDLKTKTVGELTMELQEAYKTNNTALIRSLNWDIARVVNQDSPKDFLEWQVQNRFDPFPDRSEELQIISAESPNVPLKKKVLYFNFGWIFSDIERENPGFYSMPFEDQNTLVDAKLDEIIAENEAQRVGTAPVITIPPVVANNTTVQPAVEPQTEVEA